MGTIQIDGSAKSTSSITIADADAFIVIDGTTPKQIPASDIKTYAGGAVSAINNATANELVTIGSTTTELDAETHLIYDGTRLGCGAAGSGADLGSGLHIRSADTTGTVSGDAEELVIEGSGNTGITILSGNSQNGAIHFGDDGDNDIGRIDYDHNGNTLDFWNAGAKHITAASSGVVSGDFNDTSDVALKENIQTISTAIDTVKQLRPITFDWKRKDRGSASGFIAQEVELLLPNDVKGDAYDELDPNKTIGKSLNATGILSHVTKALQESITKIETLETEMTALKARVTTLEG